ncbi:hypothetical protein R1flu_024734 [Riccia fluitans]|uniref:Vacuolar protein sorting-associated protein n=1 Tax=Riccia fluitans TaxID=41844 RepID=A0ABD1XVR5_9MARC
MFEGVLYQLLAGYLGHYVKDIQREQFRIGLWSGEALLENVELRLEAFDYLQLPFSIKQGTVGKLKFQVPWQKLGWEPILISLEDVSLLAGPHEESEWDAEASERRALAAKKAALAAAEIAKLSQRVSEDKSGETFLSYLSAKIIDNVQVTVRKVHLQYVDGETDPEAVFSFGITLSSLAITTTDGRDHPALPSVSAPTGKGVGSQVHKLVELQHLAVYWNTERSQMPSPANSNTSNESRSTGPSLSDLEDAKVYVLQPTNANLRLTVDKNASVKGSGPHYSVVVDVDNLSLSLAERQLQQMLMLAEALSVSQLRERYVRFRPAMNRPFSSNSGWQRRLWEFAIQAVVSDVRKHRRKRMGNFELLNSKRRKKYVLLYKEKLEALQRAQQAKDSRFAELEEMELEFEMDEILFFRSAAESQLLGSASGQDVFENAASELSTSNGRAEEREDHGGQQPVPHSQRPLNQQRGWLNWLSLGLLGAAESIDAAVFPDEIIKDLCEAADFNPTSVIESGNHAKGWCRLILSVRVGEAVGILRNFEKDIVSITLRRTSVTFISWLESTSVSILVPTLEVVDLCTSGSQFQRILAPKARQSIRRSYSLAMQQSLAEVGVSNALVQSRSESKLESMKDLPETSSAGYLEQNEHVLVVEVDLTTGSQEFGIFVTVSVQPVEFVYSSTFIQQALDFFSQPFPYEKREELVTSCRDEIASSIGESHSTTRSTDTSKKRIRWHIDVQKPTFLFPENNMVKDGVLMVFAWDSLLITSTELQSTMSSNADKERTQRFHTDFGSSEQFEVRFTGIQVIIVSQYSDWHERLSYDAEQESHLLERFNLHLGICCVPSHSTGTVRLKISGEVASLRSHLSSWNCVALKAVVAQIMSFRNMTESGQATSSSTMSDRSHRSTSPDTQVPGRLDGEGEYSPLEESSRGEQSNQLITSNDLAPAFELSLYFTALTAKLRVDGESGSSEVQEMVLVAQMHDANVRFSRWNLRTEEITFMVNKFHVEDANEVAGSSLRYLLYLSEDSSSSSRKGVITAEETKFGSPQASSSKNALAARISWSILDGRSISAVRFHLQGMDCHCHPKVMRALYWFATIVTEAKPVDTNAGEEDEGSFTLDERDEVSSEEVRRPFLGTRSAAEDELANGTDIPLVLEFRDLVFHLYDPGGIISSVVLGDTSVSVYNGEPDLGSLKLIASAREFRLKGPAWASGNCRGELFGNASNGPVATLNFSLIKKRRKRSLSGLIYSLTEIDISLQNVHCILQSDYLAVLLGYCMSSEWTFSISGDNLRNIGTTGYSFAVGTKRSIVILKVEVSNSMVLLPRESDCTEYMELVIPRMVISFTPSELPGPQSGSNGVWNRGSTSEEPPSKVDVLYLNCREIALIVRGLFQSAETIDASGLTLIERADGEILVELPVFEKATEELTSPPIPLNSEMDLSILVCNLAGSATGRSIDLLKEREKELSSVTWKYKSYAKGSANYWIRDRSPFKNLTPPVSYESPVNMRLSVSQLTLFIRESHEPSMDVAKLVADSFHLSCFINRGETEKLIMEVLSIDVFQGSSLTLMLHISSADEGGTEGSDRKLFPLIAYTNPELHLALPNIRVWLYISAWAALATASSFSSSPKQAGGYSSMPQHLELTEEQSFRSGVLPLSASEASSSHVGLLQRRSDENSGDPLSANPGYNGLRNESSLRVSVGAMRITCILPDFLENANMGPVPRPTSGQRKLVRIVSWIGVTADRDEPLGEDQTNGTENVEEGNKGGKQLILSSTIRINELELGRNEMWTLSASLTQTEAVVEEVFLKKHKFRMPLMQVKNVGINGRINVSGTPLTTMAFSVAVESVDVWCSYAILHFLSNFTFEPLKTRSSIAAADMHCSLDLQLHSCSILLSDSRWSCNAPIMEVLVRKFVSEFAWRRLDFECSLDFDVEINYHNIQKVAWEPLVEPWSLCCRMNRTCDGSSTLSWPCRKKLEVASSAPLNINITEALVQAVSRAVEMFNESWSASKGEKLSADFSCTDSQSAENLSMRRFAPYWLQNDTGIPFSYWFVGTAKNKNHDNEDPTSSLRNIGKLGGGEIVQPGSAVPLFIEEGLDEMFDRRRTGPVADEYNSKKLFGQHLHRRICVQLEGTSRPSLPMSIDLLGSKFFEAVFSEGESVDGSSRNSQGSFQEIESEKGEFFHAPVFFEVTPQRYSKLIRVSSMVSVVNTTSIALELRFDLPFVLSPKVMDPVLPGQAMALPVHLAESGRMRWRPLGSKHLWSEPQLLPNLLQLPLSHSGFHRPIVCYPCHPSDGPFRSCIMVTSHSVSAAESDSEIPNKGKHKLGTGRDNTRDKSGIGSSAGSEAVNSGLFWSITLKAPLVLKNCLPFSLTVKVESGAGVAKNICAPEGDSLFLYDIDTMHDIRLTVSCTPYSPATLNLKNATLWTTDTATSADQNTKVASTEALVFKSEMSTYSAVSVKAEIIIDLVSGARELRLSCPFWLYNCSDLNLVVMDGDVDISSGLEQHLLGPRNEKTMNEDMSLISAGSRFVGTISGLQVVLEAPEPDASGTVVRRVIEISPRHQSFAAKPPVSRRGRVSGKQKRISGESSLGGSSEQKPSTGENLSNQMAMYSPVQGTDVSEPHLRARIVPYRSNELGKKDSSEVNWSRPFLLEPPGGINIVTIPKPDTTGAYVLAMISAPALGSCAGKTKTITFRPRFVLANVSKQALCYKQQGTDAFYRLDRGNHAPLHWHDTSREFLISLRIDDHGWDWSGGFAPDQLGDTQVKVRNHTTGATEMLRVEVSIVGGTAGGAEGAGPAGGSLGTCLILLSNDETGFMPYRIENFTLERLRFYQQKCEKMENMLQSYSSCSYAWDEPRRPHRLVIEIPGAGRPLGAYALDEVREYPPVTLGATPERAERKWLVHVRAEGPIRVLSIVDASVHAVRGSSGIDSSTLGEDFVGGQNLETSFELFDEFSLKLAHVGLSVIDNYPQEVVYACARDLGVRFLQGQYQQILNFDVAWFQVDNQMRYPVYPVMLSVANPPPDASIRTVETGREVIDVNTLQSSGLPLRSPEESSFALSIARWRKPTGSVVCYRYISMRVEPLRLEFEERVVSSLLQLTESISWSAFSRDANASPSVTSQPWSVINGSQQVGAPMRPFSSAPWKYDMEQTPATGIVRFLKQVQRLEEYRCWAAAVAVEPIGWNSDKLFSLAKERSKAYVEILHIAPVIISVSFSSSPWLAEEGRGAAARSLLWMTGTLLQRQVRALVDVEGAPVHLRQLKLAHPLASWDVIWGMITRHYTRQLLHEVYKVLGSADVFGNPVGFIRSVASGVWEFVSASATIQSPTELVRGLAHGTRSLVTNTVFAFSNAATRFSRAARKGVTVFAMDSEYDLAMQRRLHMEGSQDISVVNEFLEGLTGLLQAPIRGAERHGLPGMLSGAALGAVGVVARPVASILEVAGMTAQSIRNSSRPAQWRASRSRLPRYVSEYTPLLVYSWERAVGQAVLLEVEGSQYKADQVYFTCMPLKDHGKFVLLTETTIIRVSKRTSEDASTSNPTYGRQWNLELEAAIDDVLHMDRTGDEVSVLLGPPNRPLIRPQYPRDISSKYETRFTPFAHETFALLSERAAIELFGVLMRLEDQSRKARSKLLLASSTSLSCSDFLDLDKFF